MEIRHRHLHRARAFAMRAVAPTLVAVVAVALGASPAGAHVGGSVDGLADGALHPLAGPDHLLAMLGVGVIAALVSADRPRVGWAVWWIPPAAFLVGMAVGGAAGLAGLALPAVEPVIAASVALVGLAVALAPRAGVSALVGVILVAGFAHGNAHGAEAPAASNPLLYVLGFLAVTAGLHLCGVLAGVGLRRTPPLRVAVGLTVATTGALLLT
jgi:urease accessory protein